MFVGFLIAANLKCLYILIFSITNLALVTVNDSSNIADAVTRTPASLALIVFCVFILCTVGGLCSYHVSVMMEDTTTRMNLKHISRDAADPSPEPGCGNLWRRLCTPPPPSFLPSHPQNWVESSPEAAVDTFDAAYGACDIDTIKRRIDSDGSHVVLSISQMRVLFFASASVQPSFSPSLSPSSGAQLAALLIPTAAPPLPACDEIDAMTRCDAPAARCAALLPPPAPLLLTHRKVQRRLVPSCNCAAARRRFFRSRAFQRLGQRIQRG